MAGAEGRAGAAHPAPPPVPCAAGPGTAARGSAVRRGGCGRPPAEAAPWGQRRHPAPAPARAPSGLRARGPHTAQLDALTSCAGRSAVSSRLMDSGAAAGTANCVCRVNPTCAHAHTCAHSHPRTRMSLSREAPPDPTRHSESWGHGRGPVRSELGDRPTAPRPHCSPHPAVWAVAVVTPLLRPALGHSGTCIHPDHADLGRGVWDLLPVQEAAVRGQVWQARPLLRPLSPDVRVRQGGRSPLRSGQLELDRCREPLKPSRWTSSVAAAHGVPAPSCPPV